MYPTVVIIIVETQRSMADVCEFSSSTQTCTSGTILPTTPNRLSFPVEARQAVTPMDKESRYERFCTLQVEDGQKHDREKVVGTTEKCRQSERTRRSVSIESDSV